MADTSAYVPHNMDPGEETPQETGIMIHVIDEGSKARWNHIEDLDSFFTRIYSYHQKHGFSCMMLQESLELIQFVFVVLFTAFLAHCVDYSVLFKDKPPPGVQPNITMRKTTLSDAVLPLDVCVSRMNGTVIICLLVAFIFWIFRLIRVVYHFFQFIEIRAFYASALKITESDLDNLTWHEVQLRLQEVQKEQQMCIHKLELTELDIYHRILRFKNYMVAMLNKSLLPVRFFIPVLGDIVFLTKGLKYNFEIILFWGPGAPFENNWHLKEDYKRSVNRKELAETLSKRILWIGIANFLLCPIILIWQVLYFFFNYADVIKREPGTLGARMWSLFGRIYLRHFNELDHELNARLTRAYKLASRYTDIFTSHIMTVIAKNVTFFAGAILAVLLILTIIDEDVLQVEHVLSIMTSLGMVVAFFRGFVSSEHAVWCPEQLLTAVRAHVHYMPDHWQGNAHTYQVRSEFTQLFQYKAVYLLEELLSPLITPIILIFFLRPKALDIIDFFRNFTVEVIGVGDVCSFAQMDIRKHGNPMWMCEDQTEASEYQQAEDGKTELSLIHFTVNNPQWKPPAPSTAFISNLKDHVQKDLPTLKEENPLLYSLSSLGVGVCPGLMMTSMFHTPWVPGANSFTAEGPTSFYPNYSAGPSALHATMSDADLQQRESMTTSTSQQRRSGPVLFGGVNKVSGPLEIKAITGLLSSIYPEAGPSSVECTAPQSLSPNPRSRTPADGEDNHVSHSTVEMSFSALYLHELHHRRYMNQRHLHPNPPSLYPERRFVPPVPSRRVEKEGERIPLLDRHSAPPPPTRLV